MYVGIVVWTPVVNIGCLSQYHCILLIKTSSLKLKLTNLVLTDKHCHDTIENLNPGPHPLSANILLTESSPQPYKNTSFKTQLKSWRHDSVLEMTATLPKDLTLISSNHIENFTAIVMPILVDLTPYLVSFLSEILIFLTFLKILFAYMFWKVKREPKICNFHT